MAAGGDGVARQAELRRIEGNICFKKARLGAAIDCYTEAIALCPDVAVYWINRALCHFKRKEWAKVEEDSRRALALDYTLVKGHYLLGCALLEKEESALAIKEFEKALTLLKSVDSTYEMAEDIWQVLAKAKYLDWEKHSTERLWRMESLKEACETALQEHHFLTGTLEEDSNRSDNEYSEQIKLLSEVFSQATVADTPTDVPDYLCCQITFEIFRDPVITPSGVTYERAVLVEHLHKVGNFDPVTREPLKEHQLVPNLAIKEAVQAYLKEHSWAHKLN
ncbi:STIP1 homology and U box-containing protein 1 isoform 1 [Zea mays]|uniref:E3 ubiquitin-protein ligase CHIP n=2 Tax=Zea mays TaxID=4577 RepID=B6TC79_MAIZE|nr:STIP1 homology and U box-containing protein 1 isoform 1 [Zea mays]ACG34712.1 STIP1 homology and U box-containing protein 1 [Zea mays]|eukprot:NP_001149248.1 STIP1 homology and U box-containing protein 1 [Zea mays]